MGSCLIKFLKHAFGFLGFELQELKGSHTQLPQSL